MYIRDNGDSFAFRNNKFNRLNEETSYTDLETSLDQEENLIEEDNTTFNNQYDDMDNNDDSIHKTLIEAYFIDEIVRMDDEERQAFFNSDAFQALYEAGVINNRPVVGAVVATTEKTDFTRRTVLACMELAKQSGDPLWEALKKNRIKEKKLLKAIKEKYWTRAKVVAKKAVASYKKLHGATSINAKYNKLKNIR